MLMSYEGGTWTDDDIAVVVDNWDRPVREIADQLGRSYQSVVKIRRKIKDGYAGPHQIPWTEAENEVLFAHPNFTASQLKPLLPGRGEPAIVRQRSLLGAAGGMGPKDPQKPGQRTLLAKTCRLCGLLLAASWFPPTSKGRPNTYCKKCRYAQQAARTANLSPERREEWSRRAVKRANAYIDKAQAITLPLAENSKQEYTEADHVVLSDPSRSNLDKALALRRSYLAVLQAVSKNGYSSRIGLPNPEQEQWFIDNPNAERVEEIRSQFESITKEMHMSKLEPVGARPDFEWDD